MEWEHYCPRCKKTCGNDEIEIIEYMYEGDWETVHEDCQTKVISAIK